MTEDDDLNGQSVIGERCHYCGKQIKPNTDLRNVRLHFLSGRIYCTPDCWTAYQIEHNIISGIDPVEE